MPAWSNSIVKLTSMCIIILILLIPVALIRKQVEDRNRYQNEASRDIEAGWGGPQWIAMPTLSVYNDAGETHIIPEEVQINCDLDVQIRSRGIFDSPVFDAALVITGHFSEVPLSDSVHLNLFMPNTARIKGDITLNGAPSFSAENDEATCLIAKLSPLERTEVPFEIRFSLLGSQELMFKPTARSNRIKVKSNWQEPSFVGTRLPLTHTLGPSGFEANWHVVNYGGARADISHPYGHESLGVRLVKSASIYQISERSVKYAVLFIGLTFFGFFMFEVLNRLRIHPIQYTLVGLGLCLFYLLLLSLGEHLPFGWAYLISVAAELALNLGYATAVLGSFRRASIIAIILSVIYAYLWVVIVAVEYALLMGTAGLFAALALTMFLTRRVDWYSWEKQPPPIPGAS